MAAAAEHMLTPFMSDKLRNIQNKMNAELSNLIIVRDW